MSDFLYAFVQLIHNVGAAAVVGSPAAAWLLLHTNQNSNRSIEILAIEQKLAGCTLLAWSIQLASGAGFGATTYYLRHTLPELNGIGLTALSIKVGCAIISFTLTLFYLRTSEHWSIHKRINTWQTLFVLGLIALIAAAFLRWYG